MIKVQKFQIGRFLYLIVDRTGKSRCFFLLLLLYDKMISVHSYESRWRSLERDKCNTTIK